MKAGVIVNCIFIASNLLAALVMLVIGKTVLHFLPEARGMMWVWFVVGVTSVAISLTILKWFLDRSKK
jgi:hypothetical protein